MMNSVDNFYGQGIGQLLRELLRPTHAGEVVFEFGSNQASVAQADIIVKHFSAGESSLCHKILLHRKRHSMIIGIHDGVTTPYGSSLPLCINDIIFINKNDSLEKVERLILRGWENCQGRNLTGSQQQRCQECRHYTLTPQQVKIVDRFCVGEDVTQIARHLEMTPKTIAAHKRRLMMKFNVKSNCELLALLSIMKTNGGYVSTELAALNN